MELHNKNILLACCYEADYGGNFIRMLTALADGLQQKFKAKAYFVFPTQTPKEWLQQLQTQYEVEFTCKPYSKSVNDLCLLLKKWKIDLVHTHFESYDIPVAKAIKKSHLDVKMVWHLHDNLTLDKSGLNFKIIRKIGTHLRFKLQYGWYGRKAYFIGVSSEIAGFVCHYRHHLFTYPKEGILYDNSAFEKASVLLNGVDLSRIDGEYKRPNNQFFFLTFGGHTFRKGIPCILDAAEILWKQGIDFSLIITNGVGTQEYIYDRYGGKLPANLKIVCQTNEVIKLFDKSMCFISAALKETMSMAIAEASIYGLPVIQSDIPGTYWNAKNESTRLFKVNDTVDLARQMKSIMAEDKQKLKRECHHTSESNKKMLSMDKWVDNVMNIYSLV